MYQKEYNRKLTTPKKAVADIKSGERVFIGQATSVAYALAEALLDREEELEDVTILCSNVGLPLKCFYPGHERAFKVNSPFMGPMERIGVPYGITDFSSAHLSQVSVWCEYIAHPDWAFFEVSAPDENGYMSFGPGGTTCHSILKKYSKHVILQVNKNTPYVFGEGNRIHVSEADMIIEADTPLRTIEDLPADAKVDTMANYILDYIPDGATIQLGIGGIAGAIGYGLREKNDLGVHSELLTDSIMYLIKHGNVTNARKHFLPDKTAVCFALGSQELYEFVDRNPKVYFAPYTVLNDPVNIAKNDNVISVNTALAVDLLGQVSSESVGFRQYSGIGGQVDFVRGSQMSKGGKSFIAINSTYFDKKANRPRSRITLNFPAGTAVTTPRSDVQYVVTEFGCVNLKTLSNRDRVNALIGLAHPDFREELREQAKDVGLLPKY